MRVWPLIAMLLAAAPATAVAGMPVKVKETCPVGGETFTYETTSSYSIFGLRPDGKPYGSWTFPLALPVCPKNGLVMYREFDKAQLARLPALITTPEYVALRPAETPYYRAAWLARALDPKSHDSAWLLLSASWEADPSQKARYQAEFAAAAEAAPREPASLNWLALLLRAVNARRELGRFDEAAATLAALPRDALEPPTAAPVEGGEAERDEENRQGWRKFAADLQRAIARRDADSEPLDLVPVEVAASHCLGIPGEVPPREDPLCGEEAIAAKVAEFRKNRSRREAR